MHGCETCQVDYRFSRKKKNPDRWIECQWYKTVLFYCRNLATGWTSEESSDSRQGRKIFLLYKASKPARGPPNLLFNRYRRLFPRGQSGRGVTVITHIRIVMRLRTCGSVPPLPPYIHFRLFFPSPDLCRPGRPHYSPLLCPSVPRPLSISNPFLCIISTSTYSDYLSI